MDNQITVSASLRFKEQIREAIASLGTIGIKAVFPNLDSGVKKEDVDVTFMQKLERKHFESISQSRALYVICPDGYVGTLVSVEVGYAKAKGLKIIFSEEPEDLGLQALADRYIAMDELQQLTQILDA